MFNWIGFLFLGTLGWGISFFLIKILLSDFTPIELVLYRMIIGFISLFIIVILMKVKIKNIKFLLRDGLMVAIFNMAVPFYLIALSEKSISTSLMAITNGMTPFFTFLLESIYFTIKFQQYTVDIQKIISIFLG